MKNSEKRTKMVLNMFDYDHKKDPGENIDYNTDLTVQGAVLPIEELIARFARGESLPIGRKTYYDGTDVSEENIDPTLGRNYDLVDADNDLREASTRIQQKEAEKAAQKAAEEAEKQKADPPPPPSEEKPS